MIDGLAQDGHRKCRVQPLVGFGDLGHDHASSDDHALLSFRATVERHHQRVMAAFGEQFEARHIGVSVDDACDRCGATSDLHVTRHGQVQLRGGGSWNHEIQNLPGGGRLQRCDHVELQTMLSSTLNEQQEPPIVGQPDGCALPVQRRSAQANTPEAQANGL